jgi:putative SOS response-associated peptidase YedK
VAGTEPVQKASPTQTSGRSHSPFAVEDSFLEWQKTQQDKKLKFEFTVRDRKPIWHDRSMGALEEPKTNQGEDTFAIVTVEANETMMPVHDRQPAIFAPRDYQEYLENAEWPPIHLLRVSQTMK